MEKVIRYIDTHAHLDFEYEKDTLNILEAAKKEGVEKIINISSSPSSFAKIQKLSSDFENLYHSLGVHPHDAKDYNSDVEKEIYALKNKKTLAIGEIGLDYFYKLSEPEVQKKVFVKQIHIANSLKLPIVLHIRDAHSEAYDIIKTEIANLNSCVVHCYTGSIDILKKYLNLGMYVSFTGVITFPKASDVKESVKYAPMDRIMLETDAPYLAPVPHRGKTNYPEYVPILAKELSLIKELDLKVVAPIIYDNSFKFFNFVR